MADKFQAPQVMVTPAMLKAGMDFMAKCVGTDEDGDNFPQVTDSQMVIGLFLAMNAAYWGEINETHKRKQAGSPIIKPTNLILPGTH